MANRMQHPVSLVRRAPKPQLGGVLGSILGGGSDSSKTGDASKTGTATSPPPTDSTKGNTNSKPPSTESNPTGNPADTSNPAGQSGTGSKPGSPSTGTGATGATGGTGGTGKGSTPPSTPPPNPAPVPPPSPTPTTSSTTTVGPTPTSTSTSSFTSSTTTAMPTSTSSSTTAPLTSFPTSSSTEPLTSTVFTTQEPSSTAAPPAGTPGTISGTHPHTSGGPNIGAIIGGIAGGLVALIVIVYLILIPVRQRAKRQKELDWLDFDGRENDHMDNDGADQSIFRTPRAGIGEDEDKIEYHNAGSAVGAMSNSEMYPMHETSTQGPHGYYAGYGAHDDSGQQWGGYGANVVGEAPYGMGYPTGYYPQHGSPPGGTVPSGAPSEMYAQSGPYPVMSPPQQQQQGQQQWPGMPAHAHSNSQGAVAAMGAIPRAVSPTHTSRTMSSPTLQRSHSGGAPLQRDASLMSMVQPLPPPRDAPPYEMVYNGGVSPGSGGSGGGHGNGNGGNGYAQQVEQMSGNATAVSQNRAGGGGEKPQRRLSGRSGRSQGANTEREEDFVLPYEREEAASSQPHMGFSDSPRLPPKAPLHLVNPDD